MTLPYTNQPPKSLTPGAFLLRGFALEDQAALLSALNQIAELAPFRHMITSNGYRMSVAMTNCGELGWLSDKRGYCYDPVDPLTLKEWPLMPAPFLKLAQRAAEKVGFGEFFPDACLINRYEPGARLSLHQALSQAGDGIWLIQYCQTNYQRIRNDAHAQERTNSRRC